MLVLPQSQIVAGRWKCPQTNQTHETHLAGKLKRNPFFSLLSEIGKLLIIRNQNTHDDFKYQMPTKTIGLANREKNIGESLNMQNCDLLFANTRLLRKATLSKAQLFVEIGNWTHFLGWSGDGKLIKTISNTIHYLKNSDD